MTSLDPAARAFLERQRVAHLATADTGGAPHVVPICFTVLGEVLYLSIDEKPKRGDPRDLRRVRNIMENPRAAVVADVYNDADWSRLGFVMVRGEARVLLDGDEHASALHALRDKYAQYADMALEERPVIAVDVEQVTVWGAV
jgi:coenzyme F420-0:L-glutamate ligase/coenzyme F420-1:gamma-L-glutamate ligase